MMTLEYSQYTINEISIPLWLFKTLTRPISLESQTLMVLSYEAVTIRSGS